VKKQYNLNYRELAEHYEVSKDYFSALKKANPKKYKNMFKDATCKREAIINIDKYIKEVSALLEKMEEILLNIKAADYAKTLKANGVYSEKIKYLHHLYYKDSEIVFRVREGRDFFSIKRQTIEKFKEIIKVLG
jgi:hypothetical protein